VALKLRLQEYEENSFSTARDQRLWKNEKNFQMQPLYSQEHFYDGKLKSSLHILHRQSSTYVGLSS
jgi:hypothetical protein